MVADALLKDFLQHRPALTDQNTMKTLRDLEEDGLAQPEKNMDLAKTIQGWKFSSAMTSNVSWNEI